MSETIDSKEALEGVIGKAPPAIDLKVIDHVDATAQAWLASSPLMFAGIGEAGRIAVTLGGGAAGFAGADAATLHLPLDLVDDPAHFRPGANFGSLFLVPGIGETLRINGHIAEVADGMARIAVGECYVHCAKALIRSEFWAAKPIDEAPVDPHLFAAASRFMALATIDAAGGADLSPKGDPAGAMIYAEADRLWFADRPGNRRADSFRNILEQPRIAAALLIPGSSQIVLIEGRATLTTAAAVRESFAVRDKIPRLATQVDELALTRRSSPALIRAAVWPPATAPGDIRPAKMLAEHLRLNRTKGIGARIASVAVSIPGLMQRGLDKDYKDNLY